MSNSTPRERKPRNASKEAPALGNLEPTFLTEEVSAILGTVNASVEKALDVGSVIEQVGRLSGREQYDLAVGIILNDNTLTTDEKLRLKAEEDERQDKRDNRATERVIQIQSSQKDVVVTIVVTTGVTLVVGTCVVTLVGTEGGRALLCKLGKWAVREVPRLAQRLVA